jgi:hypothetical protein
MHRSAAAALLLALASLAACEREGGARAGGVRADTAAAGAAVPEIPGPSPADSAHPVVRQVVYVPVYPRIYFRDQRRAIDLAATLSVRNTDPEYPLTVTAVLYFNTAGRLVRSYLRGPVRLGPMATAEYVVEPRDTAGGSGANFLVEWTADRRVTEPVIEAVMIGATGAQGISFVSVGRPLRRR